MGSNTLENFYSQYKILGYKKGDNIIRTDEIPQGVYYVVSGFVKMGIYLSNGREVTFNMFKPGSYFSLIWAIAGIDNRYYFQALTKTELRRAPKEKVLTFLKENPEVLYALTKRILIGLDGFLTNTEYMLFGDAYNRVLSVLFLFAKRFGIKKNKSTIVSEPRLTHQDIANMAGITRETASITISQLEKDNLISYKNHQIIIESVTDVENRLMFDKSEAPTPELI